MAVRALLLMIVSVGWWRVPRATRENRSGMSSAGVVVVAAAVLLALVASPLIDLLDTDAETLRVATGLALVAAGAFRVFGVGARAEDGSHRVSWLVPLVYPVLIGPELVVMALSAGADHGVWLVAVGALGGSILRRWRPESGTMRLWRGSSSGPLGWRRSFWPLRSSLMASGTSEL